MRASSTKKTYPNNKNTISYKLAILAVGIVIVVAIVSAVMFFEFVYSPAPHFPAPTGLPGFKNVQAICYPYLMIMSFENNMTQPVLIQSIYMNLKGGIVRLTPNASNSPDAGITISDGSSFSILFPCPYSYSQFSIPINITYTEPNASTPNKKYFSSGVIQVSVSRPTP